MLVFGSGYLYGIGTAANSSPRKFATLQDTSFDFTFAVKELYGQQNLPVDVRRGEGKLTGKAKFGKISGGMLNDLFFGQTASTGLLLSSIGEAWSIPAATPYTVTVANSVNFDTDLGVTYAATGLPFTKVASAPIAGQYSEAAGVYTFAAADAGTAVLVDYLYTATTGGTKITLSNQVMGTTPTFMGVFTTNVSGKIATLKLNLCTSSKLSFATKTEDYMIPEMDINIMADASNNIGVISFAD